MGALDGVEQKMNELTGDSSGDRVKRQIGVTTAAPAESCKEISFLVDQVQHDRFDMEDVDITDVNNNNVSTTIKEQMSICYRITRSTVTASQCSNELTANELADMKGKGQK